MYKMYQPNTKANKKHACDCVVRAITATTGKSWQETYDLLCDKTNLSFKNNNIKNFIRGKEGRKYYTK